MADTEYLLEIIARLRDETAPGIEALKARINSLKSTQDAENAEKDLGRAIDDRGRKEDEGRRKTEAHTRATSDSARASQDAEKGARGLADSHDKSARAAEGSAKAHKDLGNETEKLGDIHKSSSEGVASHTKAQQNFADILARVRKEQEETADGTKDLRLRISETRTAWKDFENDLNSGSLSKGGAAIKVKQFSSELRGLARETEYGSEAFKNLIKDIDSVDKYLKKTDFGSSGGFVKSLQDKNVNAIIESIGSKFDDLGLRITGVSSFLRGFFDLAKIGFSQQLITGVASLAGGLVSLASAAAQAGAALGGAFISGMGQAIPMISVAIAAALRFKNILQAVSVAGQAEQQKYYDPTEKQVTQLQNTSQLISSQQQLSNSYIQLYEAQQRVRDSQIALTEARYTASRQTKELAMDEKDAKLEAEGANLSLIESRRQLQIEIQKGGGGGAALQQAELAVKEAELSKEKAAYAIPKAEREERLAKERGIRGEPSVISAVEGAEGAKVAVLQAKQAGEAAKRQEQITELQQQARSSKETTYESQLKFLKKGMSPTELGLTNSLIEIEHELKSSNSPLKKITDYFVEPFTNAVGRIRSLLKTSSFLGPIDELAKSMGTGLSRLEKTTYGKEGTSFFETMARDAAKNIPVVVSAIEGMMKLFEKIAKAADPAFHKLSEDWSNFWTSLNKKYEGNGLDKLTEFFNRSVKFAEGFAHMGVAIFDLFKAIGHDAAPQGLLQVTSFTNAVELATKWVQSHGPEVTKFFREAREGLSVIGQLLFGIGRSLIEVFSLSSIKSFNGFIQQIILPALRDVVKILGWITEAMLNIANAIPGGKATLEALATLFLSLEAFGKLAGPIIKIISLFKELKMVMIATRFVTGEMGAVGAISSIGTAIKAVIAQYKLLKAASVETATVIGDSSAAEAASISGVTAAETGAVGGEVALGATARGGLIGGAAGLASKAFLPAAAIAALVATREGGQQTGPSGLLTGNESEFGGKLSRYSGKELGDLSHFNIGGFVSGIVGSSNDETKPEEKLRSFGNEVEKLKDKISSLPESKLLAIQHEAETLAQNPALNEFKGALESTAKSFNPSDIAAKEWSSHLKEYMEELNPVVRGVAESFKQIGASTQFIFKQVRENVKTNIESIKEDLGLNSKLGKEALAKNFGEAETTIYQSMKKGTTSTAKGMGEIRRLVSEALKKYGVSDSSIESSRNAPYKPSGGGKHPGLEGMTPALATGGYISASSGGRMARVGEGGHDEVVLSTDPRHSERSKNLLGQYLRAAPHMAKGGAVGEFNKSYGGTHLDRLLMAIDKVSNAGFPYKLGGGHENPARFEPFDCSGAISWVDQQAGYKVPTTVSGDIGQWGYPAGEGLATIFYNPVHTFMKVAGRYFGTSGFARKRSKGGAGWFEEDPNSSYLSGFSSVHLPDVEGTGTWTSSAKILENFGQQLTDKGTGTTAKAFTSAVASAAGNVKGAITESPAFQELIAPKVKGGGAIGQVSQAALNLATKAANIYLAKQIGSGAAGEPFTGGKLGTGPIGREIMSFFTGIGYPRIAAAGMIGNFMQESSLNPNEPGGGLDQGQGSRLHSGNLLTQLRGIAGELSGGERGTAEAIKKAKSASEAALIFSERFERPGEPDNANRERYAEEALGKYATGGLVGDSIRRLAIRHLRKKVLKFAQGGIAPWGGRPVPIIAHEGERIMNPSQYHETARLAGTSPGGLDRHLGYDSSPRQHFAAGGPVIKSSSAQKTTGSSPLAPLTNIYNELAKFEPFLSDPGSNEYLSKVAKIFKLIGEGFKKLKTISKDSEKYPTEIEAFVKSVIEETTGILAKLKESREVVKAKLSGQKAEAGFSGLKPTGRVRVAGQGQALSVLERQKTIKLGPGGEAILEREESKALTQEGKEIAKEANLLVQLKNKVKSGLAKAKKSGNTKLIAGLTKQYDELVRAEKEVIESMSQNIEARYQAEIQVIQDRLTETNTAYQTISGEQTTRATSAQALGNLGELGKVQGEIRGTAESQKQNLAPILAQAKAAGDKELVASIEQEMNSLNQTINNAIVEQINAGVELIQRESQLKSTELTAKQGKAQTLGNLQELPNIDEEIINNAKNTITELQGSLAAAKAAGDTAKEIEIKEAITALETTATDSTVGKITAQQELIQRESAKSEAQSGMRLGISKVLTAEGKYGAAGAEEKGGLEEKHLNLISVREKEENLKIIALQEGDIAAAITLSEELDKNSVEIAENNLALKESAIVNKELTLSQIQRAGQLGTGIYGAVKQGLETIGQTTGYINVAGLISGAKGEKGILTAEQSGLEKEASSIGLNTVGKNAAEVLAYLATPEAQMLMSRVETSGTTGEKEYLAKVVSGLETNSNALLTNTEELAKLNGELNQPQTWSTAAQQAFRQSFFNGMGNLLPSYSAALPPGARPSEMPVYGSQGPGSAQGAPTIGNLSLTHPVEKLDPILLGEELQHAISTSPTMQ